MSVSNHVGIGVVLSIALALPALADQPSIASANNNGALVEMNREAQEGKGPGFSGWGERVSERAKEDDGKYRNLGDYLKSN